MVARFAIRLRAAAVSVFARAFPPFNPPSRPKATAAGFFSELLFAAIPYQFQNSSHN